MIVLAKYRNVFAIRRATKKYAPGEATMSSVTLSSAVRANLLALQQISAAIGQTQVRLATGKRVNSALDGPAAFFTASALNARAAELNQIVDDVGLAKKVVEAASTGIDAVQTLIKN